MCNMLFYLHVWHLLYIQFYIFSPTCYIVNIFLCHWIYFVIFHTINTTIPLLLSFKTFYMFVIIYNVMNIFINTAILIISSYSLFLFSGNILDSDTQNSYNSVNVHSFQSNASLVRSNDLSSTENCTCRKLQSWLGYNFSSVKYNFIRNNSS